MEERQRLALAAILEEDIRFDCPMAPYTTFRVGGPAEALCTIRELPLLQHAVSYLTAENLPYMVVGNGSNLLVRDEGFKGVMMRLRGKLASIEQNGKEDEILLAGGGLSITGLLDHCRQKGLGGLEFLAGIPGTVGGAVFMNAGAWGKEVESQVEAVQMVSPEGELMTWGRPRLKFAYRALSIPCRAVIAKVSFRLKRERPETVNSNVVEYFKMRREKQPLGFPSAGSAFKNPTGDYAGRLIESVGLKGRRIGGAMISPKHANFIVNRGGASAADVLALMDLVRKRVKEQTGIELEHEIKVVS